MVRLEFQEVNATWIRQVVQGYVYNAMQCVANYILESWAGASRGFTKTNKNHVSDYLIILYIQGTNCMYYRVIGLYGSM